MKIGIINITGGGMCGGYRKYLRNIIPRMALHPEVEALLCASPESLNVRGWFEQLPKVNFVNYRALQFLPLFHDSELNQRLEEFSPDVIFVPVGRFFRFKEVPVVNMIQNMEQFTDDINGNPFTERIRRRIQHLSAKRAIRRSDRIIAISKFVYDFLVTRCNIPNEQIGLVYYGIDAKEDEDGCRPHIIPKSWHGNFIFTTGSIRPARGLEDLILAAKTINFDSWGIKGIVVAGETTPYMLRYKQGLLKLIKENNLVSRFIFLGKIDYPQMEWCYENCRVFIMTSRVESFGMIGLEAMANGCLCVAADNPCLPEIFRGCALYYKPKDAAGLTNVINLILSWKDDKKVEMSQKAVQQANKFSWDVCVNRTIRELLKAVEECGH